MSGRRKLAALGLGLTAAALLPLVVRDAFFLHVMITVFFFGALAQAWNLIGGYAGQISFGHAVFFGLGGYAGAVLLDHYGITPWIGMWVGAAVSVLVSVLIGFPTFHLRRHFFALATMALGEIIRILFLNWPYVGGALGIYYPLQYRNRFGYLMWDRKAPYYLTALTLLVLATALVAVVDRARVGRYLNAIDQDEGTAEMLGIPARKYKMYAMGLSAVVASLCGTIYASYVLYIDPYVVMGGQVSLFLVVVALIGGRGTVWGPVLGAVVIVFLNEYTRYWLGGVGRGLDFVIFGALVMLVSIKEPRGLVGILDRFRREKVAPAPAVPQAAGAAIVDPLPPREIGEPVLEVTTVVKRFGGVQALQGATLEVRRGEIFGLIGPNGAGKSTLFDCITGVQRPDGGSVLLRGVPVFGRSTHAVAWVGISRTFQNMRLFPGMTAWENLMCGQEHRGESLWSATVSAHSHQWREEGEALLALFGLGHIRDLPASNLSYGQQKLLSIATAALRKPAVVLLDEPAAGVNPRLILELGRHIRELNARGITFVIIEHNMDMIMDLADRVAFMAEGRVVAVGPPEKIQRDAQVLDLYYGR